jgi:pyruvate/2-oxoglutarate/acetoin dehydrogenase E1 component
LNVTYSGASAAGCQGISELASVIAEGTFCDLDGPVKRLGRWVPIPFSPPVEDAMVATDRAVFVKESR